MEDGGRVGVVVKLTALYVCVSGVYKIRIMVINFMTRGDAERDGSVSTTTYSYMYCGSLEHTSSAGSQNSGHHAIW